MQNVARRTAIASRSVFIDPGRETFEVLQVSDKIFDLFQNKFKRNLTTQETQKI